CNRRLRSVLLVPQLFTVFHLLHLQHIFHLLLLNNTSTSVISPLSLHDALPISVRSIPEPTSTGPRANPRYIPEATSPEAMPTRPDRKSTRLNSSHVSISYAVFCLKKKKL